MEIILISGYKHSGKDTVGKLLIDMGKRDGRKQHIYKFATQVIAIAIEQYDKPFPIEDYETYKDDRFNKHLLGVSDAIKKKYGEDVFLKQTIELLTAIQQSESDIQKYPTRIIITDLRLIIEETTIRRIFKDVTVVKVVRPLCNPRNNHPTETELASIPSDIIITNNGTLEELEVKVSNLYDYLDSNTSN